VLVMLSRFRIRAVVSGGRLRDVRYTSQVDILGSPRSISTISVRFQSSKLDKEARSLHRCDTVHVKEKRMQNSLVEINEVENAEEYLSKFSRSEMAEVSPHLLNTLLYQIRGYDGRVSPEIVQASMSALLARLQQPASHPLSHDMFLSLVKIAVSANSAELTSYLNSICFRRDAVLSAAEIQSVLGSLCGQPSTDILSCLACSLTHHPDIVNSISQLWSWARLQPSGDHAKLRLLTCISIIADCVEIMPPSSFSDMKKVLEGLHGIKLYDDSINRLLLSTVDSIRRLESPQPADGSLIIQCIGVLKTVPREANGVRQVLTELIEKLNNIKESIQPSNCSLLLESCIGRNADRILDPEYVRRVLALVDNCLGSKLTAKDSFPTAQVISTMGHVSTLSGFDSPSSNILNIQSSLSNILLARGELSFGECIAALSSLHGYNEVNENNARILSLVTVNMKRCSRDSLPKITLESLYLALNGTRNLCTAECRNLDSIFSYLLAATQFQCRADSGKTLNALVGLCVGSLQSFPWSSNSYRLITKLVETWEENNQPVGAEDICSAFTLMQDVNYDARSGPYDLDFLVSVLARKLESCSEKLTPLHLSIILYSVKNIRFQRAAEIPSIYGKLRTHLVRRINVVVGSFSIEECLLALHGMHFVLSCQRGDPTGLPLLNVLLGKVDINLSRQNKRTSQDSVGRINPTLFLSALNYVQCYDTDYLETLSRMLNGISDHVQLENLHYRRQQAFQWERYIPYLRTSADIGCLANACDGLQQISSSFTGMNALLLKISKLLSNTCGELSLLSSDHVMKVLAALRSSSSDSLEVVQFIGTLNTSVFPKSSTTSPNQFIDALTFLSGLDSSHEEVRQLLSSLSLTVDTTTNSTKRTDVQYLHGFQNMNYNDDPRLFDTILKTALQPIQLVNLPAFFEFSRHASAKALVMDIFSISSFLFGMQGMSYNEVTGPYFDYAITSLGYQIQKNLQDPEASRKNKRYFSESAFLPLLLSCRRLTTDAPHNKLPPNLTNILVKSISGLETLLSLLEGSMMQGVSRASRMESLHLACAQDAVSRAGRGRDIQVTGGYSQLLFGFEADVVLRGPNGITVNVEVDGPAHKLPRKRKFSQMRDDYLLTTHNVKVVRFDVSNNITSPVSRAELIEKYTRIINEMMI
jgi:hypothetical protein